MSLDKLYEYLIMTDQLEEFLELEESEEIVDENDN